MRSLVLAGLIAVAAPAVAQTMPRTTPEQVGLSSPVLQRVGEFFRAEIARGNLPGAVVLVSRKGRVVYFESFGVRDPATGDPLTPDAIFRIYGMTQPITAVAAMTLVEDGKVVLDDPVARFLPSLAKLEVSVSKTGADKAARDFQVVPANRRITLWDLLRHTSGFAHGDTSPNPHVKQLHAKAGVDAEDIGNAELVERLSKVPLAIQPGTAFHYGRSMDVLGRVIEVVSESTLAKYLQKRVLDPLGMADTGFYVPAREMHRLAQPFPKNPDTGEPGKPIDVIVPPRQESGGAGLVSTAADYWRFCQMMLNGGQLNRARILSRASVLLMTNDQLGVPLATATHFGLPPGTGFGLGFAVRLATGGAPVVGNPGEYYWNGAGGTSFWVDPKEDLIGIFMSANPGAVRHRHAMVLRQLVHQAIVY